MPLEVTSWRNAAQAAVLVHDVSRSRPEIHLGSRRCETHFQLRAVVVVVVVVVECLGNLVDFQLLLRDEMLDLNVEWDLRWYCVCGPLSFEVLHDDCYQ